MHFRVVPTHQRGIPRPKRDISRSEGIVGELITANREDDLLRRTTIVATFCEISGGAYPTELLPPLHDAGLVLIAPGGMMFRGSERIALEDGRCVEYVQE
jgi:hypothetical protein